MHTALVILGWSAFGLAIVVGLVLDLVGLFGNWLILLAAVMAWLVSDFHHFGLWSLSILALLAVAGEAIEMLAAGYGASRFGGGKGAITASIIGCLIGAVVGTPWIPIVGTLIGACVGAFVAATVYELILMRKKIGESLWTGVGAALGKVAGLLGKLLMGVIMLIVMALHFLH